MKVTVIQTADHWLRVDDEIELAGQVYDVTEVEQAQPPEFILAYGLALVPAKVIVTLKKVETKAA